MSFTISWGNPSATPRPARVAGWYIPWLYAASLALVVAVNGVMIHFALSTWTGLTTQHAYDEGNANDRALAGAHAQVQRAWRVGFDFVPVGALGGEVTANLADRDGHPIHGAVVTGRFIRPTVGGQDVTVTLIERADGRYAAPVQLPLAGIWDLRIVARGAGADWQAVRRVWAKG
ncbi:MAG: hypothetical protein GC191_17445 [Azospirillum sp.]|nr:hypothetical protein [Azospirillum sp.]